MNTQEKLEVITQQIRKDLPRLIKIGYLVNENNERFKICSTFKSEYGDIFACISEKTNKPTNISKSEVDRGYFDYDFVDIMLNDVLEWLDEIKNNYFFYIKANGELDFDTSLKEDLFWNLSKPYLKDQSKELIDFLYNLIDDNKTNQSNVVQNIDNKGVVIGNTINIGNINGNVKL